ncbi:class I SAM-dependent RNA methyltransferase [Amycolatopsis alkalitolerans]|uniref:Class I SAM-dependent RNA methyltransferase n=1 Tax=Amycolatopsis alkalitolerans TaxID=2547244 RepID=A0A5C4M4U6_9PSEU|nr:class I SAM-dependent RNA methyltransferase [Amycolatopsis alkalitolerans]TNC27664.1 class I SAM-dependent RNA methyltransferase [Amycolatopsis alkalitolerans]
MSWTGRTVEAEVGAVAHGGHCVARVEGRVVFVRHALPGEVVLAEITEDKGGSFCRADAVRVLEAAPERVEPPCPLAVPGGCGGCDWQHAKAAFQRELKARVVIEQLSRLAGIEWPVVVEELPGGPLGWRSRVRLVAGPDGRAGLRAHRSHRVVPLEQCPIAVPGALDSVLARRWRPGTELEVTSDGDGRAHVRELSVARGKRRARQLTGGVAVQHAAGRDWKLDAHGFWQVHPAAADTFARVVREWAQASRDALAWDLYAGVGLFASVLAGQVGPDGEVVAVESGRRAVADGEAALADLPQVHWRGGRVEHVLRDLPGRPEVVVLDPPRAGAGRAVVESIVERGPARVVYVACDPAALARDLATFAGSGYRLARLRAFDAFPMTHHVECVALVLSETDGGSGHDADHEPFRGV